MVNGNDIDDKDFEFYDKYSDLKNKGVEYYKAGYFAESILYFKEAIKYSPSWLSWETWVWLSLACVKLAIIDKSDSLFSEAFVTAQSAVKHLYESRNLFDEDNPKLEGEEKKGYAAANYVLGLCYIEFYGDRHNAIKKYELLKQIDPKFAEKLREIIFKGPNNTSPSSKG